MCVILDNLKAPHNKPSKAWALDNAKKIEQFFCQVITQKTNLESRLNSDFKQAITSKVPVRTKEKCRAAATEHVMMIEQTPERMKKNFGDANASYANHE